MILKFGDSYTDGNDFVYDSESLNFQRETVYGLIIVLQRGARTHIKIWKYDYYYLYQNKNLKLFV